MTPSAVDGPNALVIVNGRIAPGGAERRAPPPVRLGGAPRPHVAEAALVTNTLNLQVHGARRA